MRKRLLCVLFILFFISGRASVMGQQPTEDYEKYIPAPEYFGRVWLNNFTKQAGVASVVFDHWLHRSLFNCRICHVDIGFAMKSNATGISAADNMDGYFCGSCHNNKQVINGKRVFAACSTQYTEEEGKRCARCHSEGQAAQRKYDFQALAKKLPRLQYNQIDWEKAETEGIITPIDVIEGIFYKTETIKAQKDFSIESKSWRKSDVIFSHKKHVVWNGCAVCHPLIFPSSEQGTVQYNMFEIMDGEYCGACHVNVAFSVWLCYKCHEEPVR